MISNQYVLIYSIHVKKVIAKLFVFILRTKITETIADQIFCRGQKFRLTLGPVLKNVWLQVRIWVRKKNAESCHSPLRLSRFIDTSAVWMPIVMVTEMSSLLLFAIPIQLKHVRPGCVRTPSVWSWTQKPRWH